jgi:hypothetical protein
VVIIFGIVALTTAAYCDDNSWQGYLLAGVCLAYGQFLLVRALRD